MADHEKDVPLPPSPGMEEKLESPQKEPLRENFVILKNMLISPDDTVFDQLRSHLQEKICDGNGETLFEVGVGADDSVCGLLEEEYAASVATLKSLADTLEADCILLREKKSKTGTQGQFLVRKKADAEDFMEVRVAVVGNVDAGKSTLLGVLTHGELDNGRGTARMKLFRHKHEMETGRTSSVGNDILGFDSQGKVVNKPDHGHLDWVKICEASSKVITFIDLAGHERYLKTTVFGMTGHLPDFTMLMVGANAGVVGMTKEHLGLALALNVPVFVIVTKIDMCPPNVLQDTLKLLHKILKSAGCRKVPLLVRNAEDVVVSATNFVSERLCPIFQVSNVSGDNLDLLTMFLNLLSSRTPQNDNDPAQFQIDDTYQVPGVGVVVSGTCMKGIIRVNDTLLLGPNGLGDFIPMPIKSIHRKRMPVREVRGGQTASFALKKIKIHDVRKGQVLVDPSLNPSSCWEFKGEILVLHHPTTISTKYQAMVHVGSVRQTASIIAMDKECLRTGDKAIVHFRFIKHPEYLKNGLKMVFREGRTKAVGRVLEVIPKIASLQHQKNHKIMKMVKQAGVSDGCAAQNQGVAGGNFGGTKKQRSRRGGKHRSRGSNSTMSGSSGLQSPLKLGGASSVPAPVSSPTSSASGIVHIAASGTSTSNVHPRPDNITSPPLVTTQVSV
ncbi:LOW QUALITY PROTEIN: GTP-binding protein 1 [Procambarus clarkii]|uniref:LOW QUALITY PROTEIN: GTP-binding protein 1 n=1 Tax=Procambarus clarkii TaxID=6728 RepID=UPI001E673E56|nr:GTP-binding protein 1-like isoform X1 [Procambarus clarkii]XP_045624863.1 GTP-binding protein 1-like isoform X1 [Procambarus clarkii]